MSLSVDNIFSEQDIDKLNRIKMYEDSGEIDCKVLKYN